MSSIGVALPRPILKHSSQSHPELSNDRPLSLRVSRQCRNTVHFPPSPTLTRTFSAYSSSAYDRSPIVVLPNTCALPARGCPGRTYIPGCTPSSLNPSPDLHSRKAAINSGKHMHPRRALGFGLIPEVTPDDLTTASDIPPPPPLVPDVCSESDESDGFTGSPQCDAVVPNSLAFLPFASLPNFNIGESMLHSPESLDEEDHHYHRYEEKRRRRKRDRGKGGRDQCPRQRAHGPDSTRDLASKGANNTSGEELEEDDEAEDDDIAQCQYKSFYLGTSFGGCGFLDDETCLGGF